MGGPDTLPFGSECFDRGVGCQVEGPHFDNAGALGGGFDVAFGGLAPHLGANGENHSGGIETSEVSSSLEAKPTVSASDDDDLIVEISGWVTGYRSTENFPRLQCTHNPTISDPEACTKKENRGINSAFTPAVIYIIIGYGILAYHSVSFDSLTPVFLSSEPSDDIPLLPFKFTGGFGLSTKRIGFMMAVQGVCSMIAQLWLLPIIVKRIGTLTAFRTVMLVWPLLYLVVPYLVVLPKHFQRIGIYGALLIKIIFYVIAFPSVAILLANAAPSKAVRVLSTVQLRLPPVSAELLVLLLQAPSTQLV